MAFDGRLYQAASPAHDNVERFDYHAFAATSSDIPCS